MRRFLPVVVLLMLASTTPALARKWTSRSGGFSVEAELEDVRDGKAVLKKADGSEVSVPLGSLSLADIRYIDSVFKSAEAGLGVNAPGNPAPATSTPATATPAPPAGRDPTGTKPDPAAAKPAAAPALRYNWKAGQTFTYRVKTEVQQGAGPEEILEIIHYTVQSVSTDGVAEISFHETVTHTRNGVAAGSVAFHTVPSRPYPYMPRGRYYLPGRISVGVNPNPPEVVKVDRYGRIVSIEGGAHFPFFLGRAAHLPFEPLSTLDENPWTMATDIAFRMSKVEWLPASWLANIRNEELPGREKATFTIDSGDAQHVALNKAYEATSAAQVDGKPQIAMNGEGKLTFDAQRGLFGTSKMKMRVAMHQGAVLTEVPVQVSYDLATAAEEAQMKADAEKAKADREKLAKDLMRPLTVGDLEQIVKDLQSSDHMVAASARTRLMIKRTDEPDRKVAAALEALLAHESPTVRAAAAEALATWATKESVPALLKLLDSDSSAVRGHALRALGRLKAVSAIDRIVAQLPQDQFAAAQALRDIGPAAEPAVLKLLSQGDRKARQSGCQILQQIGTKKSLPALQKAKNDSDNLMRLYAEQAAKAIERRQ